LLLENDFIRVYLIGQFTSYYLLCLVGG